MKFHNSKNNQTHRQQITIKSMLEISKLFNAVNYRASFCEENKVTRWSTT